MLIHILNYRYFYRFQREGDEREFVENKILILLEYLIVKLLHECLKRLFNF